MIHPSGNDPNHQQHPPGYPPQQYGQAQPPYYNTPAPGNYGQPMPGGQPYGYNMPPGQHQGGHGGFIAHKTKIMQLEGIFVKQKLDLTEVITGCETENKYYVYEKKADKIKKKGKKLWKCKEKSGCYSRNCLSPVCREFKMKIENLADNEEQTEDCMILEKPCTCTCFCCNRPFINVNYVEGGASQFLGKIFYPYACCDYFIVVFDSANTKRFTISANCCQCGILCMGYPCEKCETVQFQVVDGQGQPTGSLTKKNKNCLKSAISDADNFGMAFAPSMTWEDRSLLLSAVLFIDYMLFEEKQGKNNNNNF